MNESYRNKQWEQDAEDVASQLANHFGIPKKAESGGRIGIILGAGWGDALSLSPESLARSFSLVHTDGKPSSYHFEGLRPLRHHKREVVHDFIAGRSVIVVFGRIHINEMMATPHLKPLVRLQVEMLMKLGVTTLVSTNAAVNLRPWQVNTGDLVAANGFSLDFAPNMPLDPDEPQQPWLSLDAELRSLAVAEGRGHGIRVHEGGLVMIRGPLGPISQYDIVPLRRTGALAAVTSIVPEACFATLYKEEGVKVLALSRVSNDGSDPSSSDEKKELGAFLTSIVARIGGTKAVA